MRAGGGGGGGLLSILGPESAPNDTERLAGLHWCRRGGLADFETFHGWILLDL